MKAHTCCKIVTVSLVPVTVFLLSVTFFAGIIVLPTLYSELSYKEQYGMVIDAGSSHSEVFLYAWKLPLSDEMGVVYQNSYCKPEGGGISSYVHNISLAGPSLKNCVRGILTHRVPKDLNQPEKDIKINVWVGATAGMRLLKREDSNSTHEILKSVTTTLKELGTHPDVQILSGQKEASSGWITTNYVAGNFKEQYPRKRDSDRKTMGAMDMGGASMQIAFLPHATPHQNYSSSFSIFGDSFNIYTRSYLCYGINEAIRRILAYNLHENEYNDIVENPCLHKGNTSSYNMSYLFMNQTCTSDLFPDTEFNDSHIFTFNGTSEPELCIALIRKAMNFSDNFLDNKNNVKTAYEKPPVTGNFYAFSNFYHTGNFFQIKRVNGSTLENFNKTVFSFCNLTWNEACKKHNCINLQYLSEYCIYGQFVLHVLTDGFGFNNASDWSISFVHQVNDINVGWSLGYMLNETSNFPINVYHTHHPYSTVDLVVGMIVLTLLCVVFVVFFFFTFSACRKGLKPVATGYTHITS